MYRSLYNDKLIPTSAVKCV